MRTKLPWLLALTLAFAMTAAASEIIPLWPNGAPDEKTPVGTEHDISTAKDRRVVGKKVVRLTDVSNPTLTIYRPAKRKANGTAIVVCPGGGYKILAIDLEGEEVCRWLNSLGVTAALLKYRVPQRAGDTNHILPLEDAQRALGLVRSKAAQWNLDPKRIGILGFSAGGHLTAHLCNDCSERAYKTVDKADETSCRPDFALLIYPAYLAQKEHKEKVAAEITVTSNAPPSFLTQTEDDGLGVESSIAYYLALKNAHVPAELHLFAKGGHGYGMRGPANLYNNWPARAEEWMRREGLLERAKR